jgi:hypothetical protein
VGKFFMLSLCALQYKFSSTPNSPNPKNVGFAAPKPSHPVLASGPGTVKILYAEFILLLNQRMEWGPQHGISFSFVYDRP